MQSKVKNLLKEKLIFEVLEMKGLKLEIVKVTKKSYQPITPKQESNT